ncbi:sensor histidine kinase [Winogradskyella psychrotolerans RS-3]|uniref:histidine kinase n=1 Tax=Winogradskyella psychrotolerans RS-3 TaxID=641526 RepID=S7X8I0_9FLAO|nr:PAS domain-containing sensor histidine kinase [Winogradskyella psychrotolerans]EPR72343.1 sensor histidine kinase [Winogradskyella psychrotolerans RS-3]
MSKELQDIELFQGIFQSSVEGIIVVDANGIIIKANPASEQLFGYQSGKLITQKVEHLIPNKFKKKHKGHREGYIVKPKARRMGRNLDLWGLKKDGSQFPIEISLSPTTIEQKQVVIAFIIDISERENIEKQLNISQVKLKSYAEELENEVARRTSELTTTVQKLVASNLSLEDQIQETQEAEKRAIANKSLSSAIAKNFPNGFIIVFDPNFEMQLIEGEAIIKLGLDKLIFEDTTVDDITIFSERQKIKLKKDILKTIAGKHLGFEIIYKDQYFSVNTIPLLDENTIISSALFVYSDITIQKKIERVAKSALKKEQELNELKSRFVSMASHEFRTPLSAIQTSAILIGKQNEAGKEEKRKKYVAQIKKNVKHLVVILNDFLSLSKLEEGKVKADKELFDFVHFSKLLVKEVSTTKKTGKNIILVAPNHAILLNLDSKLVRTILMNLLSNAIKYSPKNTDIHIKIEESDAFFTLQVQDQGIGIPEDEQEKLFERFFRAKNAQNIQGTGLGLNIVKQYVELMDGTIDFKSEINKGTTFLIKWPKPNN